MNNLKPLFGTLLKQYFLYHEEIVSALVNLCVCVAAFSVLQIWTSRVCCRVVAAFSVLQYMNKAYGVATMSRRLKMIGLFGRISSLL